MPTAGQLWAFLPWGYGLTVALETPVLLLGLSTSHSFKRRFLSGLWLTACTYPIVVLVLPFLIWQPFGRAAYLIAAETFAPAAECLLFYFAFEKNSGLRRREIVRDMAVITAANLCSFLSVELIQWLQSA